MTTERHLMPMCFGTVPTESGCSWSFFLINLIQALREFCPDLDFTKLVFMSDRGHGICNAMSNVFPDNPHLFCSFHLYNNVKIRNINGFNFWRTVEASNQQEFDKYLDRTGRAELSDLLEVVHTWNRYFIYQKWKMQEILCSHE